MTRNIVGILLAAGHSTRFGTNKLLHPLANGITIIQQSVEHLLAACPNSIVVINSHSPQLKEILQDMTVNIIENPQTENGIGSSIACAVKNAANADGWLIALADMPFISTNTMLELIHTRHQSPCIMAPSYRQRRGHPVLFDRYFYDPLICLNTDTGAKNIIKSNRDKLSLIEVNDPGIILDIDTREDLQMHGELDASH